MSKEKNREGTPNDGEDEVQTTQEMNTTAIETTIEIRKMRRGKR